MLSPDIYPVVSQNITEILIANVHKIPICAPPIHHPSAIRTAGPPPPAERSCASRREKQLEKPSTAMGVSHFQATCVLQTDVRWCSSWLKDVGQSQDWFTKEVHWGLSRASASKPQVFKWLPQKLEVRQCLETGHFWVEGGIPLPAMEALWWQRIHQGPTQAPHQGC